MSSGYIYVLINPSMPGLAKVGKTTRDPAERVQELGSATGVPSSFIVAYQHPVGDCHAAERVVHAELERLGHRPNQQREFFSAPLHEIVGVIARVANEIGPATGRPADEPNDLATADATKSLGDELFAQACVQENGSAISLPDFDKAITLYKRSADLGNGQACERLGDLYFYGGCGLSKDAKTALDYYIKAFEAGHWWVASDAAMIFREAGKPEISSKYWVIFFELANADTSKSEPARLRKGGAALRYVIDVLDGMPACVSGALVLGLGADIIFAAEAIVENSPGSDMGDGMARVRAQEAIAYVERLAAQHGA